ncbi:MAG: histidine phosphatase family protein [Acidimicrobiia bacterium]
MSGVSSDKPGVEHHELVLVRHGETEWSRARRHTGRTDLPLTRMGELQADALVPMLAGRAFALVLSSPLQRALDTCRRAGFGDRVQRCDDALEWDYGVFEGRLTADIRDEIPGWSVWTHPVTGGESVEEVGARADRIIATANATEGDVLLFAHAHLLRVLTARWLGLEPNRGRSFVLDTASVSVLSHERGEPVVSRWNDPGRPETGRVT